MTALLAGSFMVLLDVTIVNIAMPTIIHDLGASLSQIVWVSSVYALSFAVPLLLAARLGDRFGPKPLFVIGLMLFTAASAACGLGGSVPVLIAGRAVQGLGAAAMAPQGLVFITRMFNEGERGVPIGLSGSIGGIATVSAPLLGGVLVQTLGWRWVFFVNVPVGAVALALAIAYLPNSRPRHQRHLDPVGVLVLCLALVAIAFSIQQGERYAWGTVVGPVTVPRLLAVGAVLLVVFVAWQRFNPREPLLDLRLFRHRNYSLANLAYPSIGFAMTGLWIPLAIYLQSVLGFSALMAGLVTAPSPIASGITAPLAGRLSDRWEGRGVAMGGFMVFAVGVAILAVQTSAQTNPWTLMPALMLIGIGTGAIFAPLTNVAMAGMEPRLVGAAAGTFQTFQQLGSAFGGAAVSALLQQRLTTELPARAETQSRALPAPYRDSFTHAVAAASGARSNLDAAAHLRPPAHWPSDIASEFRRAGVRVFQTGFSVAMHTTLLITLAALVLAIAACAVMRAPQRRPNPDEAAAKLHAEPVGDP